MSELPQSFGVKLAQPALRALKGAGLSKLEDLKTITEAELQGLHGMGPNAIQKLKAAMAEQGIAFKN